MVGVLIALYGYSGIFDIFSIFFFAKWLFAEVYCFFCRIASYLRSKLFMEYETIWHIFSLVVEVDLKLIDLTCFKRYIGLSIQRVSAMTGVCYFAFFYTLVWQNLRNVCQRTSVSCFFIFLFFTEFLPVLMRFV